MVLYKTAVRQLKLTERPR